MVCIATKESLARVIAHSKPPWPRAPLSITVTAVAHMILNKGQVSAPSQATNAGLSCTTCLKDVCCQRVTDANVLALCWQCVGYAMWWRRECFVVFNFNECVIAVLQWLMSILHMVFDKCCFGFGASIVRMSNPEANKIPP